MEIINPCDIKSMMVPSKIDMSIVEQMVNFHVVREFRTYTITIDYKSPVFFGLFTKTRSIEYNYEYRVKNETTTLSDEKFNHDVEFLYWYQSMKNIEKVKNNG